MYTVYNWEGESGNEAIEFQKKVVLMLYLWAAHKSVAVRKLVYMRALMHAASVLRHPCGTVSSAVEWGKCGSSSISTQLLKERKVS